MGKLYTIPAALPFSDTLAEYLIDHYSLEEIPTIQLLLPTQRAVLAMRDAFDAVRESRELRAIALPKMQSVGQVDEAVLLRNIWQEEDLRQEYEALCEVIEKPDAQLFLTQRIRYHWNVLVEKESSFGTLDYADAMELAQSLLQLYSECGNEMIPLEKVRAVNAEFDAQHWQLRARLLQHVTRDWIRYCEREAVTLIEFRRAGLAMLQAKLWEKLGSDVPVIIAGSTGSLPATARLIASVMSMENGSVFLPGKEADDLQNAAASQRVFRPLFMHLQSRFGGVEVKNLMDSCAHTLPQNVLSVEARDLHEEAQIISMLLREALEDKGQKICVVSDNERFNELLRAEAKVYSIVLDNADGYRFSETVSGRFARLLSENIAQQFRNVNSFLALMLHPNFLLRDTIVWRDVARDLERYVLREMTLPPQDVHELLREASYAKKCDEHADAFAELHTFISSASIRQGEMTTLVQQYINIYNAARGKIPLEAQVKTLLDQVSQQMGEMRLSVMEWHEIWSGICDVPRLRDGHETHPRVQLLSPQEARLQRFDTLVLTQMNEGKWPKRSYRHASWLAPSAATWLGLSDEMEMHYAMHDIACLMGQARQVYCTRSQKEDGHVTSPSILWHLLKNVKEEGRYHTLLARIHSRIYTQHCEVRKIAESPPRPFSSVEKFPKKISPTAVQLLMQNPYGFYARYILQLTPLQAVSESLAGAAFGNVMHSIIENYTQARNADASVVWNEEMLLRFMKKAGYERGKYPAIDRLWWHRIERGVGWWAEQDAQRRAEGWCVQSEVTVSKSMTVNKKEVLIEGRIDRLESRDVEGEEQYAITDYKTGAIASAKKMALGVESQLPVLRMVQASEAALYYWKCDGAQRGGEIYQRSDYDVKSPVDVESSVKHVLNAYSSGSIAYYVSPISQYAPRYDAFSHLARVADWRPNVA